jgi:putative sterol carrier protein
MEVFTEEWCAACCERLNDSERYRQAAAGWQGSVVLQMAADPAAGIDTDRAVWIDAHDGVCRGTRVATADDLQSATYVFRADAGEWRRLLAGETDPIASAMAGRLRLTRGNLFALAKYAQAAREMVIAAGAAGGTFPSAAR